MKFIKEIDAVMKDVEYGWVDKDGNRFKEMEGFSKGFRLQTAEELLKSKLGVCWDQVELERKIFTEKGIKIKTFFIVYYDKEKCPTHTFLIFDHEGKAYWYEHAWGPRKGLHEYKNEREALEDIREKYIKEVLEGKCDRDYLVIYEYGKPEGGISCDEFYKHCEKGKKIKIA